MLLGCYVCLFLITVFLHIYSWWAAIKTRACFEMLGCVLWWMLKKKERNSLQIIWKFLFVFFKNIKCWHWGKKIAAIFWKVFLNVILEQNNKAIKARNVCIANHHILSLHPQMQCQPLAWLSEARFGPELIWGGGQVENCPLVWPTRILNSIWQSKMLKRSRALLLAYNSKCTLWLYGVGVGVYAHWMSNL